MNFDSEIRNGFQVTEQTKKVWNIQLNLLDKLLSVCKKYDLKIWADAGTLLGVVRHQGYIPWDDDIDMMMFREDYDKLIEISEKEFQNPYFLQSAYTDIKYPRGHAQLRMSNTAAILLGDINQSFHQGIFIDIFVYDAIPYAEKELDELKKNTQHSSGLLYSRCHLCWITSHPYNTLKTYLYFLFHSFVGEFMKFENYFRYYKIEEHDEINCMAFTWSVFDRYKRSKHCYDKTVYMKFENMMMPVPYRYHEILTRMYGDYMKPVKAPTMHGTVIFDTEHSYKELLPQLRKKYRKTIWQRIHDKFFKG